MPLNYKKKYVIAARIVNILLYIPLRILSFLFIKKRSGAKEKILVQDGYRLGDIVMMSRVLYNIKRLFGNAEIHLITTPEACSFLAHCNWVDRLISYRAPWAFGSGLIKPVIQFIVTAFRLSKEHYTMGIDFQGDPRGVALLFLSRIPIRYSLNDFHASAFCTKTWTQPKQIIHQVLRYEFLLEMITSSKFPKFDYPIWPKQNIETLKNYIYTKKKPLILIHPGASFEVKRWSSDHFASLVKHCTGNMLDVILIGGTHDVPQIKEILEKADLQIPFKTPTFSELEYLLQIADFVVCNDSFAAHAAWACRKKTAILYGPNNPHLFAPFTGDCFILWKNRVLTAPFSQWTGIADINETKADTVFSIIKNNITV